MFDIIKEMFIRRSWRAVKYDWQNSNTWSIITIMIDKDCCNPNVFNKIFKYLIECLKKLNGISYTNKQVWMKE